MSRTRGALLALVVVLVLIAAGVIVWRELGVKSGLLGPHTPPPPPSVTNPLDAAQRGAILAYAGSLEFADPSHDSTEEYHGQWDRSLVDTQGDTAIVEPEVNIHRTDDAELRRGRIQMKIVILVGQPGRTPQQIYDSLGVPPGVSYVWVDGLDMRSPTSGIARAVVIPADTSLKPVARQVYVYRNPHVVWNRAVARWTPAQCWSCNKPGGWCEG